jgi:hypothetical protein
LAGDLVVAQAVSGSYSATTKCGEVLFNINLFAPLLISFLIISYLSFDVFLFL